MKLNLEFNDSLPEKVTPLEAVAMVKCMGEDGEISWFKISTPDLNLMEAFGMQISAVIVTANTVHRGFEGTGDD